MAMDTYFPRDSSVGIASGYGLDGRGIGVRLLTGASVQTISGTHTASNTMVTGALSTDVKRPGREANHSRPSGGEVRKHVELCTHSLIRLHRAVFNSSSTGTTTLLYFYLVCYGILLL
jgi:hypothetical protein